MAEENAKQQAAPKASAPARTGATVTVALKHPTGIVLERFEPVKQVEPVLGGGSREFTQFRTTGDRFTINGNAVPIGVNAPFEIVTGTGYALTPGVPKDLWEDWLKQHHDSDLVKNGLIFACDSVSDAREEAKTPENVKLRSGMEPLLRKDDPRVPKKKNREGKFVDIAQAADEAA